MDKRIIDFYLQTTGNSSNKDIIYYANYNFPALVYVYGPDEWPRFRTLYGKLSTHNDNKTRRSVAASIHELAKILGSEITENDLLPVIQRIFKDWPLEIKLLALKNLDVIIEKLPYERRIDLLNYIVKTYKEAMKKDWRIKCELAESLGRIAKILDC